MSAIQERVGRDIVLPPEVIERRTWTMAEACQLIGIPYSTGCDLANTDRFPCKVQKVGGRWYVPKASLARFLADDAA